MARVRGDWSVMKATEKRRKDEAQRLQDRIDEAGGAVFVVRDEHEKRLRELEQVAEKAGDALSLVDVRLKEQEREAVLLREDLRKLELGLPTRLEDTF